VVSCASGRRGRGSVPLLAAPFLGARIRGQLAKSSRVDQEANRQAHGHVGSVTLNEEFTRTFGSSETATVTGIDELLEHLGGEEFDLVAIGSLIVNPSWPAMIQRAAIHELQPFQREVLLG
jgi:hypothetical protein